MGTRIRSPKARGRRRAASAKLRRASPKPEGRRRELFAPSGVDPDEMLAPDDRDLMSRVKSGDREAFTALVERHKNGLVRYLAALTRNRDRAEEIAQDAFVRLFQFSSRYEERGQFVPYLYRIATNLLRSEERKMRHRAWLLRAFSTNGHEGTPSPQAVCLRDELNLRVAHAITTLPLRYRSPLLLREMEGWSYHEIARTLGCDEGTVKSRIHRGRERLRLLLEPYWNGGSRR